jgi:hypothetical protein
VLTVIRHPSQIAAAENRSTAIIQEACLLDIASHDLRRPDGTSSAIGPGVWPAELLGAFRREAGLIRKTLHDDKPFDITATKRLQEDVVIFSHPAENQPHAVGIQ